MRQITAILAALLLCAVFGSPAHAQSANPQVVSSCGGITLFGSTAQAGSLTVDNKGTLCTNASGGGGGTVTITSPLGPTTTPSAAVAITDTGTPITGQSMPAGGQGLIGWLSAAYGQLATLVANSIPTITVNNQASVPVGIFANDVCMGSTKKNASIGTATTTNLQVVAPNGSTKVYICGMKLVAGSAAHFNVIEGTGAACTTSSEAAIFGSTTAANGMSLAANGGWTEGFAGATVGATATAGNGVCILVDSSTQFAGNLSYVQQ